MVDPWMRSVVLTNANENYNLYDLMKALDKGAPERGTKVQLQAPDQPFSGIVYIGNQQLTATDYGVFLFATQAFSIELGQLNVIYFKMIFLRSTQASTRIGVTAVQR